MHLRVLHLHVLCIFCIVIGAIGALTHRHTNTQHCVFVQICAVNRLLARQVNIF